MKNLVFIFSILLTGFSAAAFSPENNFRRGYDGNAYIFVEGGVEFSVFPDGQFDFVYIGPQTQSQVIVNTPSVNISYNSGYNYETYVQYDDYGAVIQIENVPIFYDEYGRIIQAGNVDIRYNDRRIVRVGGLKVIYNNYGSFSHYTGIINRYNPYYIYKPWHVYYAPPIYSHCIVYDMPYRRYYTPVRYSYHEHIVHYKNRDRIAYQNARKSFYRPGSRVYDKSGRVYVNKEYNPNRVNTMIASNNSTRSNANSDNTKIRNSNTFQESYVRTGSGTRQRSSSSRGAADYNGSSQNISSNQTLRTTSGSTRNLQDRSTMRKTPTQHRNSNTNTSETRSISQSSRTDSMNRSNVREAKKVHSSTSQYNNSRGNSANEVNNRRGRG